MIKSEHFERELALIKWEYLREMVADYLDYGAPAYFWSIGASSSGKYHPAFSQGEGGLVRHTKAVVMFAEELLRMNSYAYMPDEYKDYVIAACILHDTCKYGFDSKMDKTEYKNHASNAAIHFQNFWLMHGEHEKVQLSELLLMAIRSHMGQWSTEKDDRPFTPIDRCVHMADYMASRPFIHIPEIIHDWEMKMMLDNESET